MTEGLRQLRGALFDKSLAGIDIEHSKILLRGTIKKWLREPGFEQEVEKRRHRYDSMEYQGKANRWR